MAGKLLFGVAAVALLSAGGAAQAADVMPVLVPAVTPMVVPPPPGPVFAIRIDNSIHAVWTGTPEEDGVHLDTDVDMRLTAASGWGFELLTGGSTFFAPLSLSGGLTGRVFHSAGDVELGVYAGFGFSVPGGIGGYGFGGDFRLDNDRLTVESYLQANFFAGAFNFISTETDVTVHASDKFDVYFGGDLFIGGGPASYDVWAGAQYDFGVFAPYGGVWFGNDTGFGAELGFELEKKLGNGPLSLIGGAEVNIGLDGLRNADASVGIRYQLGHFPDD